jgi:hypothetical protein
MKHLKVLTALAIGVVASSSGMIQVGAATYFFNVDFATKEVANFNDYKQTYTTDTYDLDGVLNFYWSGAYRYDSCPTNFTQNITWSVFYRINATGSYISLGSVPLPDFLCSTTNISYFVNAQISLPTTIVDTVLNDDANFIEFRSGVQAPTTAAAANRVMTLTSYTNYFDITYNFNTTYLFNYFLSDQKFDFSDYGGPPGSWVITSTQRVNLRYVYTTAGNDEFYIVNTNTTNIASTRKKYAIDYNLEFFRGESIGALFDYARFGSDTYTFNASGSAWNILNYYRYYFLNSANEAQAIVDAPVIGFTEEVCSGGFLDINVGCYVNNALAYIVNDAPVISDAFTLLNTGIELAAQTFGIIGNFSDDNVFGYLILVGFGFIAVKWFLKNDE